ncbi:hypothetical protein [Streptomyces sp. NPDC088760]|uniref:hypothetical protein n=1 Tax=Streptomyces sp. NPDC088760 TaxID=3365890 RepID=UPI0037F3A545
MTARNTEPHPVLPRVLGAVLTGAALAVGARSYHSWIDHHNDRSCQSDDMVCITWWGVTAVPLLLVTSAIVLAVVYKRLDIRPRAVIVPPTILLAPVPLVAADTIGDWWGVTLIGGLWTGLLALGAWNRHRIPALTASAAILLAAMVSYYG